MFARIRRVVMVWCVRPARSLVKRVVPTGMGNVTSSQNSDSSNADIVAWRQQVESTDSFQSSRSDESVVAARPRSRNLRHVESCDFGEPLAISSIGRIDGAIYSHAYYFDARAGVCSVESLDSIFEDESLDASLSSDDGMGRRPPAIPVRWLNI